MKFGHVLEDLVFEKEHIWIPRMDEGSIWKHELALLVLENGIHLGTFQSGGIEEMIHYLIDNFQYVLMLLIVFMIEFQLRDMVRTAGLVNAALVISCEDQSSNWHDSRWDSNCLDIPWNLNIVRLFTVLVRNFFQWRSQFQISISYEPNFSP